MMKYFWGLFALLVSLSNTAQDIIQDDWSLEECVKFALENNLQIQQSRISANTAKIGWQESKLDFLPNLNGQATHGYNWGQAIDPFTNQFATNRVRSNSFGVSSSMTLFSGLQKVNTLKRSKYDYLASQEDVKAMENNVSLNVANAYLQVLLATQFLNIATNQLEQTKKQLDRTQNLVDVGQMAEASLLDVKAQFANDEAAKVSRENDLSLAYLQLYQLLQIPAGDEFQAYEPNMDNVMYSLIKEKPGEVYDIALINMPQIAAAEYRQKSAKASKQVAAGTFLPRLSVSGSYGTGFSGNNKVPSGDPIFGIDTIGVTTNSQDPVIAPSVSYADFITKDFEDQLNDNLNQTLSLSLSIPIFNGNKARYNHKRAKLSYRLSEIQVKDAKNQLRQDIERAYTDAVAALKSYESGKRSVEASKVAFENARLRFEQNLINAVEYSDVQTRYANAQAELARSKYNFVFRVKVLEFYKGENITLD